MIEITARPDTLRPSIPDLYSQRNTVDKLLDTTWQRRMILEGLLGSPDRMQYLQSVKPDILTKVFTLDEYSQGQINQNSDLDQLLQSPPDSDERERSVEKFLLKYVLLEYKQLSGVKARSYPSQLFAFPDDDVSPNTAEAMLQGDKGDLAIGEFLDIDFENEGLQRPFLEMVLEAEFNRLTGELGLQVLSDPKAAEQFYTTWIKEQQSSPDRITWTPTYREAARQMHGFMRRNGKNRTIARAAINGPPGHGKTEIIRAINRIDDKPTYVISARPHLGFDELVATAKIVNTNISEQMTALADFYGNRDPLTVARILYDISDHVAKKPMKDHGFPVDLDENTLGQFRARWLIDRAGISSDIAHQLAGCKSKNDIPAYGFVEGNLEKEDGKINSIQTIKNDFIEFLGRCATEPVLAEDERNTQYLAGLILTADQLGFRVIIDEAEKIYIEGESASFGGLEELLTRQPGDIYRVGDIEHRFSDDFCIDLSMNLPSIPDHIQSRFGGRTFSLEANDYDRIGIVTAGLANREGKLDLTAQAQEKMMFFVTFAWPAIERAAKMAKPPESFDLRLLQSSILSVASHGGRSRGKSMAQVLNSIRNPAIHKMISRFMAFRPQFAVASGLRGENQTSSDDNAPSSPLINGLINGPENIIPAYSYETTRLSDDVIAKLPDEAAGSGTDDHQCDTLACRITIREDTSANPEILFSSQIDTAHLYRANISWDYGKNHSKPGLNPASLSPTSDQPLQLVFASSYGNVLLVKQGNKYCTLDSLGILSGEIDQDPTSTAIRPVSSLIENPADIHISPDGRYIYYIKDGQLSYQPLGVKKTDKTVDTYPPVNIVIPDGKTPARIHLSSSGNLALIQCADHTAHVLDLAETQLTGQPIFYDLALKGDNWQLAQFQNITYIYNKTTKQGFQLS